MTYWWMRFAPLVGTQRLGIFALGSLAIIGVGLEAVLPWPMKLIIDNVLRKEPLPGVISWLSMLPGAGSSIGLLAWLAAAVLIAILCVQALQLVRGVVQAAVSARLRLALGALIFEQLQSLSLIFHRRERTGDLLRRVTNDAGCLPTMITDVLLPVLTSTVALVVLFAIMWQLDSTLAIVAAAVALPMGMLMRLLGPRMAERAYEHQEAESVVWAVAEQTLTAVPIVQGFGREQHEESRFKGVAHLSVLAYLRTLSTQIQFRIGIDSSEALGVAAIMAIGGYKVLDGSISVGTLVVFLSYLTALYAPLLTFAYLATTIASAAGSARRIVEVLDATEKVTELPGAVPLQRAASRGVRGHVQLDSVTFGYQSNTAVLHEIDLEVQPGETLALVGQSGAGKSTLAFLIPRLYDPWHGRVVIDGQDIRNVTLESVRDTVAIVPQDPFLLPMSIADNIAYGRPSATRAEIEAAARAASADEFIQGLPQRYETVIGERGLTLSGGQRQRLSIARALLKDAPILILDEPTSALDVLTEQAVLGAMDRLRIGRTTIVIAHRLSTVRRADRIVVLEHGNVVAVGTHDSLLAKSAIYRMLYQSQHSLSSALTMPGMGRVA